MGFSVSVCHPEVAQSQAQPTALQVGEACTAVELVWLHCREQQESDPFQRGSDRSMGHCTHHWAPVSYWGAVPRLQKNSSSFLQSAQWPGYGVRHTALFGPLGITGGKNHREQAEHEAAHGTFFTARQGLELCRKPSDISQA